MALVAHGRPVRHVAACGEAAHEASGWKSIQRLAYPFYVLIYVHLALFLAPSALAGKETAVVSLTVYTVVMAAYVLCRTRKALQRKAKAAAMPASPA
ncbi:MAG: hypothetical protein ACLSVD_08270 [Eggerthellaceae bacterium]